MTSTEEGQLSDLQSEFKKLRVDLSSLGRNDKHPNKCNCRCHVAKDRETSPSASNSSKIEVCKCRFSQSKLRSRIKRKKILNKCQPEKSFNYISFFTGVVPALSARNESQETDNAIDYRASVDSSCLEKSDNVEISVAELAGYFDNLLYIPRKMSHMAEMMYT